ncbi:putative HSP20-like chaperone [Helianthus annuus]|nr:putative HSP20-like chaperone [Helianthus annuus]
MPAKEKMNGGLLTTLTMDNNHFLSMDSSLFDREMNRVVDLTLPPDINLPFSVEPSPPNDSCDLLDAGLGSQHYQTETQISVTKSGKKSAKRLDSMWGAWFFFNFYFKPALNEKSKNKGNRENGYDKSELKLDVFLVQHDMENMYMWAFKERPENALGKMQLRSYMNGHSRQGEKPFPFCADKGFVRSHRMQRKHYRGLSNPQCVHGIEVVRSPNLMGLDEEERRRWMELTGRDLNFSITLEASDFGSWRNLPNTDFEIERPLILKDNLSNGNHHHQQQQQQKRLQLSDHAHGDVNGYGMDLLAGCNNNKRRKNNSPRGNDDESSDSVLDVHHAGPHWVNDVSGVLKNATGPVTAAKTIYEDEEGFLIVVSLPCVDLERVKVTWRNTLSQGIVKISCVSTGCIPVLKRQNRMFKMTDLAPEHCPPGEFVREIQLPLPIPEDANLEAYRDETGTLLEIIVPKHRVGPEEHEVRVCLRPSQT